MSCKIEKQRSVFKLFAKYGLECLNYSTSYYARIRRLWNYIFWKLFRISGNSSVITESVIGHV